MRAILRDMETTGQIEKKNFKKYQMYKKTGSIPNKIITEEELMEQRNYFPEWKQLYQKEGAKKVCPVIGTEDLFRQIQYIFESNTGWIDKHTLYNFFISYLNLPNFDTLKYVDNIKSDKSDDNSDDRINFEEIYQIFTPRQRDIFIRHFLNNQSIEEIISALSFEKSTIYLELAKIKEILKSILKKK